MKHCGFGTDYRPDHTYSMLSRYNGIGSLKLSMAAAHNQRTSNPYISEVTRTEIAGHRNDTTDTTYAEIPSELSPMARMANAMRKAGRNLPKKEINDLNANATKFNLLRKPLKNQQKTDHTKDANNTVTAIAHGRKNQKCIPKIKSTNSIYSTSTISNSSLQEYDDNELDTTELAKYMRQINNEIHHDTK